MVSPEIEMSLLSIITVIFSISLSLSRLISILKSSESTQWRQKVYAHDDSKEKMRPLKALYAPLPHVEASPTRYLENIHNFSEKLMYSLVFMFLVFMYQDTKDDWKILPSQPPSSFSTCLSHILRKHADSSTWVLGNAQSWLSG